MSNDMERERFDLLPCPFCGESSKLMLDGYESKWVCCDGCGAATSEVGVATEAQAAAAWNRRATPAPAEAQAEELDGGREHDQAIEALRRGFCALPRFSFLLDAAGNVRRVPDKCGNWVDFEAAHTLFDPVWVDSLLAKMQAEAAVAKASNKESGHA